MSDVPTSSVVSASLAKHWDKELATHMVQLWQEQFALPYGQVRHEPGAAFFQSAYLNIRLRGMADVPSMVAGGTGTSVESLIQDFALRTDSQGQLSFILAMTGETCAAARKAATGRRCVVFPQQAVVSVLNSRDAVQTLKRYLLAALPSASLVPYNYLLAPDPNMFFGRTEQIEKLLNDSDMSFAIVGPGKIGKTSLIAEYRRRLLHSRDARAQTTFFIDMHECGHRDPDSLAKFLARKVEGTSRSQDVTVADFFNMLRRVRSHLLGRRPELLLDEADEICHNDFFQKTLGEATKLNLCRLILCGRGQLLRVTQAPEGQLGGRLAPIRLEPLDGKAAEAFLVDPLTDLGLRFAAPQEFLQRAFELTGRLPHLMQVFGRKVAEIAFASGVDVLDATVFDTLRWDYELAQLMTSPLDRLSNESRTIAISLLKNPPSRITYSTLQNFGAKDGFHLGLDEVKEVANELFIHNVLAWSNGYYRIAYDALPYYAREMGILDLSVTKPN